MKRYQREAKKFLYETLRQKKVVEAEKRRIAEVEQAAKIRKVLVRGKSSPQKQVELALTEGLTHPLFAKLRRRTVLIEWGSKDRRDELLRFVAKTSPRLISEELMPPLAHLTRFEWLRPLDEWKPAGKSKESVFRSLAEHLLARYPTPHFLWSTFFYEAPILSKIDLQAVTAHVAGGGAFYDLVKDGKITLSLTRRQCHDFLQETTSEYSFVNGLRRIQVLSHGGDQRLYRIWVASEVAPLQDSVDEAFWDTVLRFFAHNPLLDPSQIEPLIDYIRYQRGHAQRTGGTFTMKGRTVVSLMRDMETWHGVLAKDRQITGEVFTPSGYKTGSYERTYKEGGRKENVIWTVTEILTAKELAAEGRALHHCVYSYARSITAKHTSIWSLKSNDTRVMTIEVTNGAEKIVQYRGNFNAVPKAREFQILQAWASENSLTIASGRW